MTGPWRGGGLVGLPRTCGDAVTVNVILTGSIEMARMLLCPSAYRVAA